ncbi:MAG: hypothetical protein IKE45_13820 [Halomonas sp.]|nr:hypothetical protein [Halomonas sp.]MBR2515059.1 hypothetical protein [Halomonas sp.]
MRLTPWLLSITLGGLLLVAGPTLAEQTESDETQHEALDDAALEEKYGIKAGAVQRDEEPTPSDTEETSTDNGSDEEEDAEGGTGGTGSAEDAIEEGEDEMSE